MPALRTSREGGGNPDGSCARSRPGSVSRDPMTYRDLFVVRRARGRRGHALPPEDDMWAEFAPVVAPGMRWADLDALARVERHVGLVSHVLRDRLLGPVDLKHLPGWRAAAGPAEDPGDAARDVPGSVVAVDERVRQGDGRSLGDTHMRLLVRAPDRQQRHGCECGPAR